jgi:hypothetical protein
MTTSLLLSILLHEKSYERALWCISRLVFRWCSVRSSVGQLLAYFLLVLRPSKQIPG